MTTTRCWRLWAAVGVVGLVAVLARPLSRAGEVPLEDFEDAARFARWTFWPGAEFPGATGSLVRAEGRTGAGARLAYDFPAAALTWPPTLVCRCR